MIDQAQATTSQQSAVVLFQRFFASAGSSRLQTQASLDPHETKESMFARFFDEVPPVAVQAKQQPVESVMLDQQEAPVAELQESAEPQKSTGLVARLKQGLHKTRSQLTQSLQSLLARTTFDADFFEALETQLIMADVGVETTTQILAQLQDFAQTNALVDQPDARQKIQAQLKSLLIATLAVQPVQSPSHTKTGVQMTLIVGVNGVGKTTTIGKLAHQAQIKGQSVMLAAGDTFRAAAVEQLQIWGERAGVAVVAQGQGADSASVIYDAFQSAQAKNIDVLIADTAGRLHNKSNLMNELKKIVRVVQKLEPTAPHRVLLVVDGCTGQNALSQGREFSAAVPLTGVVVTKLDGTAKGGILFALSQSLGVPIEFIGIGEGVADLRAFEAEAYVDALLDLE